MEIEHVVRSSEKECNDLYMMAISVATATYPSVDAENAAILAAMPLFKSQLDLLAEEAFNLGISMCNTDVRHKEMTTFTSM